MIPRQNMQQRWFECSACGAAMEEDETAAAQQTPAPRQQPDIAREQSCGLMRLPGENDAPRNNWFSCRPALNRTATVTSTVSGTGAISFAVSWRRALWSA